VKGETQKSSARLAYLGISNVIMEIDALIAKEAATSTNFDRCSAGGLIWELKELLAHQFNNCIVEYQVCSTACNMVAHGLAAAGLV